ncbi:acid phosphatase type 7-like [Acanthaster planci]|uniref:Purple acid phosphatase n=1 Tax=Acanthaster planci TaxID=133434 RepID=A0A8B7XQ74_ACAPL|nr:acid phosphatase type 7-like [Acanthaster planci]
MTNIFGFPILVASVFLIVGIDGQLMEQPEQVHLSATGDVTETIVTWSTFNDAPSVVQFGMVQPSNNATGSSTKFVDGGSLHRAQFIHRVTLTGLEPGIKYVYRCGSEEGWSPLFFFTALRDGSNWSPRLALYGDMGNVNAQSLGRLQVGAQGGQYDAILHVGDFAYNFDDNDGKVGDEFMRQIESVAAYVPYMTTVGNHENAYNFSHYKNRFTMPSYEANQNLWYSWNIGPVHFVMFSTEVYFFTEDSKQTKVNQLKWLEEDLKEASDPKNRTQHPWIITLGHRPMYCADLDGDDCTKKGSLVRAALEDLFYKYGVDMEIWAHEHNYERLWPVYHEKVYNGSTEAPYTNPKAPVHITTGSGGCQEHHDLFSPPRPWDAFRALDYGFTLMHVINGTHLTWQQISDDKQGKVIDQVLLIKDKHGPEAWL